MGFEIRKEIEKEKNKTPSLPLSVFRPCACGSLVAQAQRFFPFHPGTGPVSLRSILFGPPQSSFIRAPIRPRGLLFPRPVARSRTGPMLSPSSSLSQPKLKAIATAQLCSAMPTRPFPFLCVGPSPTLLISLSLLLTGGPRPSDLSPTFRHLTGL